MHRDFRGPLGLGTENENGWELTPYAVITHGSTLIQHADTPVAVQPCFLSSDFPVLFSSSKNFLTFMTIFLDWKVKCIPCRPSLLMDWMDSLGSECPHLTYYKTITLMWIVHAQCIHHFTPSMLSRSLGKVCATLSVCRRFPSTWFG